MAVSQLPPSPTTLPIHPLPPLLVLSPPPTLVFESPSPTIACSHMMVAACGGIVNSPRLTTPHIPPPTAVIVHPLSLILDLPSPSFPPGTCMVTEVKERRRGLREEIVYVAIIRCINYSMILFLPLLPIMASPFPHSSSSSPPHSSSCLLAFALPRGSGRRDHIPERGSARYHPPSNVSPVISSPYSDIMSEGYSTLPRYMNHTTTGPNSSEILSCSFGNSKL